VIEHESIKEIIRETRQITPKETLGGNQARSATSGSGGKRNP